MKTTVSHFWLQATASFPDGAPQREEYDSDDYFASACSEYCQEWRNTFVCGDNDCRNRDCPQHFPDTPIVEDVHWNQMPKY